MLNDDGIQEEATLNLGTGIQCSHQHPVTHKTEWSSYNKASSILLCYIPSFILSPNCKLFALLFLCSKRNQVVHP
jgi:hypothetical protein